MKLLLLALAMLVHTFANAQFDPNQKVFYGLLHAHTLISDGSGTPAEAFAMAKAKGLHFFAVTEHNHDEAESGAKERKDGVQIATNTALYNGANNVTVTRNWKEDGIENTETIQVKPLIKSAKDATTANFVALYGQEFSTISSSNHANVFGIPDVLTVENGDFKGLLNKIKTLPQAPVLQFNHPDVATDLFYNGEQEATKKKMFNDYGIDAGDLGPHFKDMVAALDPYVHLIEVLSGPALSDQVEEDFQYKSDENDYYFYLKQGFHISPSVGQDNHYKTWGGITDARVGVITTTLTETNLYEAMKLNRTFATEDKNLKVILYINDALMGSSINAEEESELKIQVMVEDADEPNADYEISLYGGDIGAELSTAATNWKASDGLLFSMSVKKNAVYSIPGIFSGKVPEFFYVRVTQNATDDAWTAPVWINEKPGVPAGPLFFWTSNPSSKVFHLPGCNSIERIKPENLVSGPVPPAGRTQHQCVIPTDNLDH